MRYTTVIDISEYPTLYRNHNVRLVYLHLVLKSGYHDDDRDLIDISIRNLSASVGLTVSAVRHALAQLQRVALIERQGPLWKVKKWQPTVVITSRKGVKMTQADINASQEQRKATAEVLEAAEDLSRQRAQQRAKGKTSFMVYYEGLQEQASQGDLEAAQALERHRATYEAHKAQFEQEKAKKK